MPALFLVLIVLSVSTYVYSYAGMMEQLRLNVAALLAALTSAILFEARLNALAAVTALVCVTVLLVMQTCKPTLEARLGLGSVTCLMVACAIAIVAESAPQGATLWMLATDAVWLSCAFAFAWAGIVLRDVWFAFKADRRNRA